MYGILPGKRSKHRRSEPAPISRSTFKEEAFMRRCLSRSVLAGCMVATLIACTGGQPSSTLPQTTTQAGPYLERLWTNIHTLLNAVLLTAPSLQRGLEDGLLEGTSVSRAAGLCSARNSFTRRGTSHWLIADDSASRSRLPLATRRWGGSFAIRRVGTTLF